MTERWIGFPAFAAMAAAIPWGVSARGQDSAAELQSIDPSPFSPFPLAKGKTTSGEFLKEMRAAGFGSFVSGRVTPSLFNALGIGVAHTPAVPIIRAHLKPGTHLLSSRPRAVASCIAVNAARGLAIPDPMTFPRDVATGIPASIPITQSKPRALPTVT